MQITVVCLGNICRSPIGEAVLKDRIARAGLTDVRVDSAGTGSWHVGEGAHPKSVAVLTEAGYELDHVVRQITPHWIDDIDLLLAMDTQNYHDLEQLIESSGAHTELHMFRHFDPELAHLDQPHPDLDVPDPYFSDVYAFREVLAMVERASDGVVIHITQTS